MIQWADNFSLYRNTGEMLEGAPYAGVTGFIMNDPDPTARPGSKVFELGQTIENHSGGDTRIALPQPTRAVGCALRLWVEMFPSGDEDRVPFTMYRTPANATIAQFMLDNNGSISFYYAGVMVKSTVVPVITTRAWHHLESFLDNATGYFELRREGRVILEGTVAAALINADVGILCFTRRNYFNGNAGNRIKTLVIWDKLGTENTDFQGPVEVFTKEIITDVSLGWSPSVGSTGFPIVGKNPTNDDTYISAAYPPPPLSEFGLTDILEDITSVRAIIPMFRAAKSDSGDGAVAVGIRAPQGDLAEIPSHAITTAFTWWYGVIEQNPATDSPFTPLELNDITLTLDRKY